MHGNLENDSKKILNVVNRLKQALIDSAGIFLHEPTEKRPQYLRIHQSISLLNRIGGGNALWWYHLMCVTRYLAAAPT